MIYEAPEILALAEQKERLENALKSIGALIPENYYDWKVYGNEFSDTMTMIMYHIMIARGIKPDEKMLELVKLIDAQD